MDVINLIYVIFVYVLVRCLLCGYARVGMRMAELGFVGLVLRIVRGRDFGLICLGVISRLCIRFLMYGSP